MKRFLKILSFLLFSAFLSVNAFALEAPELYFDITYINDIEPSDIPTAPTRCIYGDTSGVCSAPLPQIKQSFFMGWKCKGGCLTDIIAPGENIATNVEGPGVAIELIAYYQEDDTPYEIKFYSTVVDGNVAPIAEKICYYGKTCYTISAADLTPPDDIYTEFVGWSTDRTCYKFDACPFPEAIVAPGENIGYDSNLLERGDFYPVWRISRDATTVDISFTDDDSDIFNNFENFGFPTTRLCEPGARCVLPNFAKNGREFAIANFYIDLVGWICDGNICTDKVFLPGTDISNYIDYYEPNPIIMRPVWKSVGDTEKRVAVSLPGDVNGYEGPYLIDLDCTSTQCLAPSKHISSSEDSSFDYTVIDAYCDQFGGLFGGWICINEDCVSTVITPGSEIFSTTKERDIVLAPYCTRAQRVTKINLQDCLTTDSTCYSAVPKTFYVVSQDGEITSFYDSMATEPITDNVLDSIPEKRGYSFENYYLDKPNVAFIDKTGYIENLLSTLNQPSVTLYANWEEITCDTTQRYVETTSEIYCTSCPSHSSNSSNGHKIETCTCNTGYSLNGSNKAGETTIDQDCSANRYTISYVLNGGTQASSGVPTSYSYDTRTTINGTPTPQTGYAFVGWCTDSALQNCSKTQTISANSMGNKTFYAKFERTKFYISYDPNLGVTGENPSSPTECEYGSGTCNAPSNPYTPEEPVYAFIGWRCIDCADTETIYKPGDDISALTNVHNASITLVAEWELLPAFDIIYVEGDNALFIAAIDPQTCISTSGDCILISPDDYFKPTDENMIFAGYACYPEDNPNACPEMKMFQAESDISNIYEEVSNPEYNDILLRATYLYPSPYKIYFKHPNGTEISAKTCQYGQETCNAPMFPTNFNNQVFSGWKCKSGCVFNTTTIFKPGDNVSKLTNAGNDVVLEANFEPFYKVNLSDICGDTPCAEIENGYYSAAAPTTFYVDFRASEKKAYKNYDSIRGFSNEIDRLDNIPKTKGFTFTGYTFTGITPDGHIYHEQTQIIDELGTLLLELNTINPHINEITMYSTWTKTTCSANEFLEDNTSYVQCVKCPDNSSNSSDGHTNATCTCSTGYSVDGTPNGDTTTTSSACAPITYKINYKSNDETISSGTGLPASYTYGKTTQITGVPKNGEENYEFAGWCTDDALTNCAMTQTITANTTGNKTFYAKWEKRYFTVGYDKGILRPVTQLQTPAPHRCTAGEPCTAVDYSVYLPDVLYVAYNGSLYFFTGWQCTQGCDDTTTIYSSGADISKLTNTHKAGVKLTAQWTNSHEFKLVDFCATGKPCDATENKYTAPAPNPIYVKYGVGLFEDKKLTAAVPYIKVPKRFGYSFDGYYTTTKYTKQFIDPKGAVVKDMLGVYIPDDAKELYSKWTEIVCNTNQYYKVTGDVVTCASCPANSSNTGAGTGHKKTSCICNTGYNYSGGTTTTTSPCQPNTYDITYELDGGTASLTGMPTNYTYGVGTTITGTPQKTGYTFNGWCNDPEKLDCYTKGEPIVINTTSMKDITLYASWTVNRFDIRYLSGAEDATGTEPANSNCIYSLSEGCTAPENPYTRTGYKFVAWGYNDDTYAPGTDLSTITTGTNGITMTAIWEPITFSIKYSGNGGTGNNPSAPVSCTYDSECVLPDNPYSLSGNTFKGWKCVGAACANTEKIYSENESISNAVIVDKAIITFTAVWEPNIYTFTVKPEFYDEEPFNVYLKYGMGWYSDSTAKTPINSLPSLPVRDGFAFLGLYTNDAANIQIVDSEGNFIKTPETLNLIPSGSSIELRDKWSAKPITCEAGTYYPGTEFICSTCPVGSYCPGGIFDTADNTENGKHTCPDSGTTTAGAESIEQCYKANLTFTAVNGSGTQTCYYSEDAQSYTNTCKDITITSCNAGYYFNSDENTQDCIEVGIGYYSTAGNIQKTQCPDGGTTLTSVSTEAGACFKENLSCAIENGSGQNTCNYSVASQSYSNCGTCMVTSCDETYSWVDNSCIVCPANSVCHDKKMDTCSELTGGEYPLSDAGTTNIDMCYKPCEALGDIQEVTGREYFGIESTCQVTRCVPGFYINDNSCEICPAGSYCDTGLSTYKSCATLGTWTSSDSGAGSINDCYKTCEPYEVTNGTAVPVKEKVFYPEECQFKGQSETGNPCEIIDGVCIEKSCNGDYEMIDGECVPCEREFALTYKQEGNCRIDTCVAGYHSRIDYCEPDIQLCEAPNALYAEQTWDKKRNAFGTCKALECQDGYHVAANACVSDFQQCNVENGIGVKEWNHNKNGWDKCVATSCNPGYSNDPAETNERNVQCGECKNKYSVEGELAVSSYVQGCEIAACMYQGERYNLENNECVPICPTEEYEDETGTMVWDESSETCIRTCKDGYVMW